MIGFNDILKLSKQLFPTGRAWKLPENSLIRKLIYALGKSEQRAVEFVHSTLYRILPDNDNFTEDDATEWERRLNISGGTGYVSLEIRKSSILRKYQFPGAYICRQNFRYIEAQLQLAGYDVTVTENYEELGTIGSVVHKLGTLHGYDTLHGKAFLVEDLVANSAFKGEIFTIDTYKGCFYIDGTVPINAIKAFRQLILTLKPANTVAILRVEYTATRELIYITGENIYTLGGKKLTLVK